MHRGDPLEHPARVVAEIVTESEKVRLLLGGIRIDECIEFTGPSSTTRLFDTTGGPDKGEFKRAGRLGVAQAEARQPGHPIRHELVGEARSTAGDRRSGSGDATQSLLLSALGRAQVLIV